MYRLRMESCLLLGAAFLAGCSDRNTPTAPARPRAATAALTDRPYSWTFMCQGDDVIGASWNWHETATDGTVTVLGSASAFCNASVGISSGSGVRPANANGFSACVGLKLRAADDGCKSWTFDPAGAFNASLTGSVGTGKTLFGPWKSKTSGKLTVDS